MEEREFDCNQHGMADAMAFLEEYCIAPKPGIIMDEIVSNIVRCSGANTFSVALDKDPDGVLTMIFSDDGKAFDPTVEAATPDVTASVDERSIGGLGIFMVKKMSKAVEYARHDGKNVLTVKI